MTPYEQGSLWKNQKAQCVVGFWGDKYFSACGICIFDRIVSYIYKVCKWLVWEEELISLHTIDCGCKWEQEGCQWVTLPTPPSYCPKASFIPLTPVLIIFKVQQLHGLLCIKHSGCFRFCPQPWRLQVFAGHRHTGNRWPSTSAFKAAAPAHSDGFACRVGFGLGVSCISGLLLMCTCFLFPRLPPSPRHNSSCEFLNTFGSGAFLGRFWTIHPSFMFTVFPTFYPPFVLPLDLELLPFLPSRTCIWVLDQPKCNTTSCNTNRVRCAVKIVSIWGQQQTHLYLY